MRWILFKISVSASKNIPEPKTPETNKPSSRYPKRTPSPVKRYGFDPEDKVFQSYIKLSKGDKKMKEMLRKNETIVILPKQKLKPGFKPNFRIKSAPSKVRINFLTFRFCLFSYVAIARFEIWKESCVLW